MIFDNSLAENKDLLKKYIEFWDVVKHKIKKTSEGKETDYRKDYKKIKFESDDDLPSNERLIFYEMHIFVRFVFKEDDKLCPELFLDETSSVKEMNFGANKTLVEVIKEGAFGGTYFREIYSGINGKWYRKSWKEFDQLKDIDKKYYCSDYCDLSVNKYDAKCGTLLRFWENKGWLNKINPYGWFPWYFRYWLGRKSKGDERQINRRKKVVSRFRGKLVEMIRDTGSKFYNYSISP